MELAECGGVVRHVGPMSPLGGLGECGSANCLAHRLRSPELRNGFRDFVVSKAGEEFPQKKKTETRNEGGGGEGGGERRISRGEKKKGGKGGRGEWAGGRGGRGGGGGVERRREIWRFEKRQLVVQWIQVDSTLVCFFCQVEF